jgi:hypothetical protein
MKSTKVIFRKYKDGDVIALMPETCGNMSAYTCGSYMHIGQHGAADPHVVIAQTKLAKPSEFRELASELRKLGYRLQVIKRYRYSFLETRRRALNAQFVS